MSDKLTVGRIEHLSDKGPSLSQLRRHLTQGKSLEQVVAEAERRGEARILQELLKQPEIDPVTFCYAGRDGEFKFQEEPFGDCWQEVWKHCRWCKADWDRHVEGKRDGQIIAPDYRWQPHPANDCLYARALASAPRTE